MDQEYEALSIHTNCDDLSTTSDQWSCARHLTEDEHAARCGNFDIIWDHFSRVSRLHTGLHAPWGVLYVVPKLIGC